MNRQLKKSDVNTAGNQPRLPVVASGEVVQIAGERGQFTVTGMGKDGSVSVYGGIKGKERFRSFAMSKVKFKKPKVNK